MNSIRDVQPGAQAAPAAPAEEEKTTKEGIKLTLGGH
jgi:hypothetical protein